MTMKKWLMMMVGTLALLVGLVTSAVAALSPTEYADYIKKLREGKLTPTEITATLSQLSVEQLANLYPAIQDVPAATASLTTAFSSALAENKLDPTQIAAVWEDLPAANKESVTAGLTSDAAARLVAGVSLVDPGAGKLILDELPPTLQKAVANELASGSITIGQTVVSEEQLVDIVDKVVDPVASPSQPTT